MSDESHTSLGDFPVDWRVARLTDVATKIQDGTHFSPQSTSGPFLYLTSKNVRFGRMDIENCSWISEQEHRGIYARCDVRYGDVLLTKDGANTGNAALNSLKEQFSLLSSVAIIRTDDESAHSPYVLQYILSSQGQQRLKDMMAGNAITRLTLEKIKAFTLPLPPVRQQRKIARILTTLDNVITQTEALIAKYQAIKQGLMHDLFTRGVDATGKLRPPQSEAPELYKQSELGWIPKEWEVECLDAIIRIIDCKHYTPLFESDGIPFIRPRNVRVDGLDFSDVEFVSIADYRLLTDKHEPTRGDIVFSRNASFGVPCFIDHNRKFAIGQDTVVMTPTKADTRFVYYSLLSQTCEQQVRQASTGSTFGRINLSFIRDLRVSVPACQEQLRIVRLLDNITNQATVERDNLNKLKNMKTGLMQDLLTGKVSVNVEV